VHQLTRSPHGIARRAWPLSATSMKAQTATNNYPRMRKCKLHWKRTDESAT